MRTRGWSGSWQHRAMDLRPVAAILVALALAWAGFVALLWVLRPRDTSLRELLAVVPDLLRLLRDLVRDRSTPLDVRAVIVVLVAWIVSPIDLIPEFIPVAGPLDDAVVAVLILRHILKKAGREVVAGHWRGDPAVLDRLLRLTGVGRRSQSGSQES
jgi:uncharacterized membrane protein YkvA (DUF1232 family)